jgi:hypothetical protein
VGRTGTGQQRIRRPTPQRPPPQRQRPHTVNPERSRPAASRTRTRIGARYHRLHRRFGGRTNPGAAKKAAFATAHTLIKIIWSVLATGAPYQDLGHDFYTRRNDPQTQTRRLITQLEALSGKRSSS